ncbi:6-phosphofructokinase [Aerococcaceae bacterium NML180378]|nr:6-phosphofructokinase [Aerococcaceae bacterium NML180378]MDO4774766.1 6-phosphofructokinase [Aerococcaceae bacterium]
MKRIAVLTSGGDAPGMNAAICAVVERGEQCGLEVYGVYYGFKGLVDGDLRRLTLADCHDKMRRGGTFLYSARFPEFREPEVRLKAIEQLKQFEIDALVVIGGDGSFTGALKLTEHGFPAIGIPGTIDNDIPGTEYTIGFDTAVNVALAEVDKISDTASSHNRTFIVEVMGRDAGDMATWIGVASGADAIIIPEEAHDMEAVVKATARGRRNGKDHSLIILSEGVMSAPEFAKQYSALANEEVRSVTLSHVQRGGAPSVRDRAYATMMGAKAVDLLIEGQAGLFVGVKKERIATFDIIETLQSTEHEEYLDLYYLNKELKQSN